MKRYIVAIAGALLLASPILTVAQHDEHAGPAMNFHRVGADLATGGHLTDGGLEELRAQGVDVVIDLRDKPPEGHGERLGVVGIEWINVPVVWRSPELADYEAFRAAMNKHGGAHVLVQCQANYRASAFTYLYRVLEADVPEKEARKAMNAIWKPEGTWAEYIEQVKASYAN